MSKVSTSASSGTRPRTLSELFNEFPWKTFSKFNALAKRYGFTDENEVKKFLKEQVPHDGTKPTAVSPMLPIYSAQGGEYQMDTMFIKGSSPWLILININTRKAYAYKMKNKGTAEVVAGLEKFLEEVDSVRRIRSDQDSAYLSSPVLKFMREHSIDYRTTEDNNHNVLGIINRFMRTLRDLGISSERMSMLIKEYNNTPHRSLNGKTPNEAIEEEQAEVGRARTSEILTELTDKLNVGDRVRVILEKARLGKNRTNLSSECYIVDTITDSSILVRAKDGSVDSYPGYRLVKCDSRYKVAETIKDGKRGIIEEILDYDSKKNTYKVRYDEGTVDVIPAKNLREKHPTKLAPMERKYWAQASAGKAKTFPDCLPAKIQEWL